jgi:hypothetical protein
MARERLGGPAVKACRKDADAERERWWREENERIAAQRALWAALPEFGPGAVAADALKAAMIERAWQLLDGGQWEACDALLEFVPEADASKMLNEYFAEGDAE